MSTEEQGSTYSRNQLIIGAIAAVAIIAIVVLSIMTFVKTVSDENTISTLHEQLVALQTQLSTARGEVDSLAGKVEETDSQLSTLSDKEAADISSLQNDLSSTAGAITELKSQISGTLAQVASLQAEVNSDSGVVASMQTQLSSINSQLTSMSNVIISLQNTLTNLESGIDSLQIQVNALKTGTGSPTTLFTSKPVSQSFGTETILLYSYIPTQSGYINISGTSSSTTGYIRVTNNTTASFTDYAFGTSNNISALVTGGRSYSISFGNTDVAGTITATLNAVFYPSTAPGTHSVTLFTSQPVSQSFGTLTLLSTYVPTYSGHFNITGISSSATSYIKLTNNTTAASVDYAFGTNGAISVPVVGGQSYSIRFGNTEVSGTVTATVSATYYY
jgi:hypothetical protein